MHVVPNAKCHRVLVLTLWLVIDCWLNCDPAKLYFVYVYFVL